MDEVFSWLALKVVGKHLGSPDDEAMIKGAIHVIDSILLISSRLVHELL